MANFDRTPLILVPGVITPAQVRYAALIEALGPGVNAVAKDLEVYSGSPIPDASAYGPRSTGSRAGRRSRIRGTIPR